MSCELSVPWLTLEKFCAAFYINTPTRFRLCSKWNPMICNSVLSLPFSFWHEWKWLTCGQRIFCVLTRHTLHWKVQWICRTVEWGVQGKLLVLHQQPLHSVYVTMWCGFTSTFILVPFFFESITPRGPVRCIVTSASYENILKQHVITALQELNWVETTVFMSNGAQPHIGRKVQRLLRETFTDERIISRSFPNPWPAKSPDLNPCDFWLWGYFKDLSSKDMFNFWLIWRRACNDMLLIFHENCCEQQLMMPFYGCSM